MKVTSKHFIFKLQKTKVKEKGLERRWGGDGDGNPYLWRKVVYDEIILDIKNMIAGKSTNTWRLNNTRLYNTWLK